MFSTIALGTSLSKNGRLRVRCRVKALVDRPLWSCRSDSREAFCELILRCTTLNDRQMYLCRSFNFTTAIGTKNGSRLGGSDDRVSRSGSDDAKRKVIR